MASVRLLNSSDLYSSPHHLNGSYHGTASNERSRTPKVGASHRPLLSLAKQTLVRRALCTITVTRGLACYGCRLALRNGVVLCEKTHSAFKHTNQWKSLLSFGVGDKRSVRTHVRNQPTVWIACSLTHVLENTG